MKLISAVQLVACCSFAAHSVRAQPGIGLTERGRDGSRWFDVEYYPSDGGLPEFKMACSDRHRTASADAYDPSETVFTDFVNSTVNIINSYPKGEKRSKCMKADDPKLKQLCVSWSKLPESRIPQPVLDHIASKAQSCSYQAYSTQVVISDGEPVLNVTNPAKLGNPVTICVSGRPDGCHNPQGKEHLF